MDPLTQGLLGATIGQAVYGRSLGRRAIVWGGLVAMLPDLDVVAHAANPMAEWLWHRGPTHALWFGPVVGPVIGWLPWRWKGGRRRHWTGLATLALFTHPLLDLFTSYGTQLLAPFARTRFALDAVAIIDPLYSALLAAALVVGWRSDTSSARARRAAWTALALSSAYLALGLVVNGRAEAIVKRRLGIGDAGGARVHAYPTLLQLPLRRVVAHSGRTVWIGWVSVLAPESMVWERFEEARGLLVDAARQTQEARVLEWFAGGETTARVEPGAGSAVVEFDDLRFGIPGGDPRDGLWGVRVRLSAGGQPLGPGEAFRRPLRRSAPELLGMIWTWTVGDPPRPAGN